MNTVYFGTSDFAVAVLRRLVDAGEAPKLVVAPPDRPKGRSRRTSPPPAAAAARELGVELLQSADVNAAESAAAISGTDPDLGLVCAFGQILREPLLSDLEMLNVHPSLLPRWRGAAPIERTIMAGDERTGVCIAKVTAGLDSGPVALTELHEIAPGDDYGTLAGQLAELAGRLAVEALRLHRGGALEFTEQTEEGATYAEKIEAAERRLDPARSAVELERVVRALTPHIGAHLELVGGDRLGVSQAHAEAGPAVAAGTLSQHDGALWLGCAQGTLRIERVRPAGGRAMDAGSFLRGHAVPVPAST